MFLSTQGLQTVGSYSDVPTLCNSANLRIMSSSLVEIPQMRPGPTPDSFKIERISNAQVIADILYKTQDLTDEVFLELVDDLGYRAARLVLRDKALSGDVKALDLYHRIVTTERKERAARAEQRSSQSTTFSPVARPSDSE